MLEHLQQYPSATRISCDIAIVGGGAAGITLARHLSASKRSVCLIESGGLDFDEATQALADGPNLGAEYYPLIDSRLRFLGGTTNIWGGRCARFDAIDFARRKWVEASGWPLDVDDLAAYYTIAAADFELGHDGGDPRVWQDDSAKRLGLDKAAFITRLWRFDEVKERFSTAHCRDVLNHPDVRVLLHTNVVRVQAADNAASVVGLEVASLDGRRTTVTARVYVLAAGGIENARLLLASNDVEAQGVGNGRDQVGRYFMEHPHGRAAVLEAGAGFSLWAAFQRQRRADGSRVAPVLLPAEALQRSAGILNTAFTFKLQRDAALGLSLRKRLYNDLKHGLAPTRGKRRLWHAYRDVRKLIQRTVRQPIERLRFQRGTTRVNVMVRGEQAPNPASRVTLAATCDALGMPHAALDWRLSAIDKRTVAVVTARLGEELARLGVGRLEPAAWLGEDGTDWPVDATVGNHPIGGYHHMGTTRMSVDPAQGVVDGNCRVHGYANLYIAGSSVFPTSSWANPTLTILALAHRLGDHLLKRAT
ncbi:MAG: GMC family oxidoreductase [Gammaproteobacteria bacterium]